MMRGSRKALLLLPAFLLCGSAESRSAGPRGAEPRGTEPRGTEELAGADFFPGLLVPASATDLYAPESSFRIMGWSSFSGDVAVLELVPDGQSVRAGERIARFEFFGERAKEYVEQHIRTAEAEAAQSKLSSEQALEGLRVELRRKELDAQRADLDLERERAISKRQAALYRIDRRIAAFEVQAATQRLAARERASGAEAAYQALSVKRAHAVRAHYAFYAERFAIYAPHDGVVRHAFNGRERRKVQKGDEVSSGQRVVSVAKDARLAAKFFVPEHRLAGLNPGIEVIVTTRASAEEYRAVITSIDFFPQELGFLLENPDLPNGREKAFTVLAEFREAPRGLSAATELRVRPRTP